MCDENQSVKRYVIAGNRWLNYLLMNDYLLTIFYLI